MGLSRHEVKELSAFAKIALDDDELAHMQAYLSEALELLQPIFSYELDDVSPTFHPIGDIRNVAADDTANPTRSLTIDEALANAAKTKDRSFVIPSILKDEGGER